MRDRDEARRRECAPNARLIREGSDQLDGLHWQPLVPGVVPAPDGRELVGYTHQDLADMIETYRATTTQVFDDSSAKAWSSSAASVSASSTPRDWRRSPSVDVERPEGATAT
ncbi:MAG: hypothetical protein M3O34_14850 [Chloroflexota bacterium]|nr:hypothetical protein [Chloroflexota bacterium]